LPAAKATTESATSRADKTIDQHRRLSSQESARVDVTSLETHVEAIIDDILPFLKQNLNTKINSQFLSYLRKLVVTLAVSKATLGMNIDVQEEDNDDDNTSIDGPPVARSAQFLRRQLTSILDDALNKYLDQMLTNCMEDMVTDISETIFNEMAFYRLMNSLHDEGANDAQTDTKDVESNSSMSSQTSVNRKAHTPRFPPINTGRSTFRAPSPSNRSEDNESPPARPIDEEIYDLVKE